MRLDRPIQEPYEERDIREGGFHRPAEGDEINFRQSWPPGRQGGGQVFTEDTVIKLLPLPLMKMRDTPLVEKLLGDQSGDFYGRRNTQISQGVGLNSS